MTGSPIILPAPPKAYDPISEAVRNANIKTAMDRKLDVSSPALYGGIPEIALKGASNFKLIIDGAVWTQLPFDTLIRDTDPDSTYNSGSSSITPSYDMDVLFNVRLILNAPSGSDPVEFYIGLFENTVLKTTHAEAIKLNSFYDINFQLGIGLLANKAYDLRAQHTYGVPIPLDMTQSLWWSLRVTPNPAVAVGQ